MATALKLKNDIKKLKAAIGSKATPKSFVPKLKAQLDKAENELASMKKSGRPRKTSTTKGTEKTLTALQKLIQKKKYGVYQGAGVDLKKDAGEGAFATGRRVSKGLKSNQWGEASENKGNVYYEYRPNRLDVKQPKKKQSYPKLEKGGYMADGGLVSKEEFLDDIYDMAGSVLVVEQSKGVQLSTDNRAALTPFIQKYSPFGKSGYGSVSVIDEVDMDGEKYYYMTIGYPKMEKGGYMADDGKTYSTDMKPNFSGNDRYTVKTDKKEETFISVKEFNDYIKKLENEGYKRMADGGETVKYYGKEFKNTFDINDKQFKEAIDSFYDTGSDDNYERVSARLNISKLRRELGEEKSKEVFEYIKSKFAEGGMMAKGGKLEAGVYRVGKPNKVSPVLYEQKIVEIFDNGDIATASDYGRKLSDFKVQSYPIITTEQLEAQYKMEKGGYMAKGGETVPYIIWVSKDGEKRELHGTYKSQRAADMAMRKLWDSSDYNSMGNKPKKMYEKEGLYAKGGYMAVGGEVDVDEIKMKMYRLFEAYLGNFISEEELISALSRVLGKKRWFRYYRDDTGVNDINSVKRHLSERVNKDFEKEQMQIAIDEKGLRVYDFKGNEMMADGGEVGKGFYIREMKEKLNKMFPDSFGFTVGNFSKEGDLFKNSSALIVDTNSPFNGLQDSEIKSNLFFPQYKRDHDIRFRIYQGGENTYFYFLLESENGDQYIGQFGFKDEGDVSADYITRFIAFLMEQYGLPFEVKHSVMAKGGYMEGGGEMHKADYFKDGGKVFSEKELKEILDEALGHFYQGLNQIDLAMRYLEVKGQGGLKTPLSNKLKLDDLRESVEKIDEYISK